MDKIEQSSEPVVKAPKHVPTEKYLLELIEKHPEIMEQVKRTPQEIIEGAKQIKVNTMTVAADFNVKQETDATRDAASLLPHKRRKVLLAEMGVKDPDQVPVGKVSLREAIHMISAHRDDPEKYSVETIAGIHDMKSEDVFSIVDHFKLFQVYHPEGPTNAKHQTGGIGKVIENQLLTGAGLYEQHRLDKHETKMFTRKAYAKQLENGQEKEEESSSQTHYQEDKSKQDPSKKDGERDDKT